MSGNVVTIVGWLFAGMIALGSSLLTWAALALAGDAAAALVRWRWKGLRWSHRPKMPAMSPTGGEPDGISMALTAAGLLLAALARDAVLSLWLLLLGGGLARWWKGYVRRRRRDTPTAHVLRLLQLLNNYLRGSVVGALSRAADRMDEGRVRDAVEAAVRAHVTGTPWDRALQRMTGLDPFLDRLALLLMAAPQMEEESVREGIESLIREITARERLEAEVGAELVLLKATVRFLAVADVVAVVASLLIPAWRDFFTSTMARRGTFVVASLTSAAAFVYFSEEIEALREEL